MAIVAIAALGPSIKIKTYIYIYIYIYEQSAKHIRMKYKRVCRINYVHERIEGWTFIKIVKRVSFKRNYMYHNRTLQTWTNGTLKKSY